MDKQPGQRIRYRVLKNPETAPKRSYTADAEIIEVHPDGRVTVCFYPKRADPTMVGPIPHVSERNSNSADFRVWEEI